MRDSDGSHWSTDKALFAALPGGRDVIAWFGFVPSFHDATLDRLDVADGAAAMGLRTFRTTEAVDASGCFVLDRHALVTIRLSGVSGLRLTGNASSIVAELGIRRMRAAPAGFGHCAGPGPGDIEVRFESSYGLEGSICARDVSLSLVPA